MLTKDRFDRVFRYLRRESPSAQSKLDDDPWYVHSPTTTTTIITTIITTVVNTIIITTTTVIITIITTVITIT